MDENKSNGIGNMYAAMGGALLGMAIVEQVTKTITPVMQKLVSGEPLEELKALPAMLEKKELQEPQKQSPQQEQERTERPERKEAPMPQKEHREFAEREDYRREGC